MEDAGLYKDNELWDFGKCWDVNAQHFHSELPVTVPHGDSEHSFMIFPINCQLLMSTCEEQLGAVKEIGLTSVKMTQLVTCNSSAVIHLGPVILLDQFQIRIRRCLQNQVDLLTILQTLTDPVKVLQRSLSI